MVNDGFDLPLIIFHVVLTGLCFFTSSNAVQGILYQRCKPLSHNCVKVNKSIVVA